MELINHSLFVWLLLLIALTAILYSSVGHGGASGYIAAMALFGVPAATMKPAALVMNIAVTVLVLIRLSRAGYFKWDLLWPFALGSIPAAYLGGSVSSSNSVYNYVVGAALLATAVVVVLNREDPKAVTAPKIGISVTSGAGLGFMSGFTGVGGGIFLSPLLLFLRWADIRTTAAVSAAFILVNSVAGLLGHASTAPLRPAELPAMAATALLGAWIGSELAVRRLAPVKLRKLLGVVLLIAGLKMIFTA